MNKVLNILLGLGILGLIAWQLYKLPKFSKGEDLQDFTATLIDGSTYTNADLSGHYILLDFWGSWCGPCRKESPDLVALYKDYNQLAYKNASGFEIVSVAIETNERSWKNAIKKDNLSWPYHIVQLDRFNSPIAKQYGVREIPTKYLISPDGVILGVNQGFEEIRQYLDSQRAF